MGGFWNYEGKTNAKELVDWDLNIYLDPSGDTDLWFIDPYVCKDGNQYQYENFTLTMSEAYAIMDKDPYFDGQEDVWYGMQGFLKDYWEKLPDRIKFLLESLPKYTDDLDGSMVR